MKVQFWITLVPKWDRDKVTRVVADKITANRPRKGHGLAVKVSLDVNPAIFAPVQVEGEIGADAEVVQLRVEDPREEEPDGEVE